MICCDFVSRVVAREDFADVASRVSLDEDNVDPSPFRICAPTSTLLEADVCVVEEIEADVEFKDEGSCVVEVEEPSVEALCLEDRPISV